MSEYLRNSNIYVVHSPDDGGYYLEDRTPGDWKISHQIWSSRKQAIAAYDADFIIFEKA